MAGIFGGQANSAQNTPTAQMGQQSNIQAQQQLNAPLYSQPQQQFMGGQPQDGQTPQMLQQLIQQNPQALFSLFQ